MMAQSAARPVAHYLTEFGTTQPAEPPGETDLQPECPKEPVLEESSVLVQAARKEGIAEGYAKAQAEHDARIEQEQATFEIRLAAERERWAWQESEELSNCIKASFAELEIKIAESVARALTPLATDALRRETIDLLSEHVRVLLDGGRHPIVEIHGPEDLLNALRERLGAASRAIGYFPNDLVDVRIIADQTVIESQLEAWRKRIKSIAE